MSGPEHAPLLPYFLRYARRYWYWGSVAAVAIVLFGVASGAMLALIHPIFDEVLLVDRGVGVPLPGLSDPPQDAARGEAGSGPMAWARRQSEGIKAWAGAGYERLKQTVGVAPGNRFLQPIVFAPLLFVLVFVTRSLAAFVSDYSFQRVGLGITTDIRNDLYRRIINQSSRFHGEHTSGELFSRVVSDVSKLQVVVSSRLLDLLQQSVALVIYVAILISIHLPLALICLVATPAFIYPIARFGEGMRRTSHRSQERMADLSALLTEGIRGNRVVKAFNMEDFECERFNRATARHLRVNLRAQLLASASSPVVESLAAIGGCTLVVYVGLMIRADRLTPALFVQFLATLLLMYDPIRKLNRVNLIVQEAVAAAQRVADLMSIPIDIVDRPTAAPIQAVSHSIRFERVSFAYHDKQVLDAFDLELRVGEVVALVGPSGAGKSTVVSLLPRFFDPDRGRILIDGIDIKALPLENLRSLIGIVTQETILFNDSARNNIAYGRTDLPLERVREAAAAAYADEFIMELQHGYDTVIGEAGQQLSGGQRQRLAIARALLKNAPILILDEATSHLDSGSEALLQRALSNLMQGRTSLVIAHRLSTVTRANRIVVMESGRIQEVGTHERLLRLDGAYKRVYDLQFKV